MISTERPLRNHMITTRPWSRNSWKLSEVMWETTVLQCGHGKKISKHW